MDNSCTINFDASALPTNYACQDFQAATHVMAGGSVAEFFSQDFDQLNQSAIFEPARKRHARFRRRH